MSDDVTAAIDRVDAHIAASQAVREREYARWKRHYCGESDDPGLLNRHLGEIAQAVGAAVPRELPPLLADDLTRVADAFLAADSADRDRWTAHALARNTFVGGHGVWFAVAERRIAETRDPVWLRRGLAVAALVCGGHDSRDERLSLSGLLCAARDAGIDWVPEIRHVAALASTTRSFGGSPMSVQRVLVAFTSS